MTIDNANAISIVQDPPTVKALVQTASVASTFVRSRTIFDLTRDEFERLDWLAKAYSGSAFNSGSTRYSEFDYKLIMLKGLELGIPPMGAVDYIDVIHGKPALSAKGMLALVQASGDLEDIQIESTDTYCTVTIYRKGKTPYTETFTEADARKFMTSEGYGQNKKTIPLWEKANWRSQPRTMLKWRAITAALRATFPDRTGGLYTHEELDPENVTVDDDGSMQVVRSQITMPSTTPSPKPKSSSDSDNGDDTKVIPKWHETEDGNNLKELIAWARHKGMVEELDNQKASNALLKLAGAESWNAFDTGKAAWAKLTTEHEMQLTELANRNADKSQAAEQPEVTPPAAATDTTPETSPTTDEISTLSNKDKAALADWIKENFAGRDMATVSQDLDTDWSEYSTLGHAKNALIKTAETECYPIITDMLTHKKQGRSSYLLFASVIDEIRAYSRQELVKMLGEDFPDTEQIKTLPEGESLMLSKKIAVTFEAKGHYNNVIAATDLEAHIPF